MDHITEVWIMARAGEELTIQLYRDDESIHVDGGNGEVFTADRDHITARLVPGYEAAGWTLTANYETALPLPAGRPAGSAGRPTPPASTERTPDEQLRVHR